MANCNEVNKTVNLNSSENFIESNVNQNPSSNMENVEKIKAIQNYEDSIMKRANNPQLGDEHLVHIWSIDDNLFPKVFKRMLILNWFYKYIRYYMLSRLTYVNYCTYCVKSSQGLIKEFVASIGLG